MCNAGISGEGGKRRPSRLWLFLHIVVLFGTVLFVLLIVLMYYHLYTILDTFPSGTDVETLSRRRVRTTASRSCILYTVL